MPLLFSIPAFLLLTLPWLNPFAPGPSPAVVPWLVALAATAGLLWLGGIRGMVAQAPGALTFAQRWATPFACALLVAGLASSAIGLLQYFDAAAALEPWVRQGAPGEAYANLRQRNQFATLTNIGLAALVWGAVRLRAVADPMPHAGRATIAGLARAAWVGAACGAAAALLAVGNAASSSRTGLVQLLMLFALAGLWGGWRRPEVRRLLWVAALAYVLAAASLPWLAGLDASNTGILARLHEGGAACSSRLTLWRNVLYLIVQKPWFGWGWAELDFAHFTTLYPGARFCEILDNAHNLPLHLAVELGVPIALLACGTGLWLAWRAKPWREGDATRQMAWSVLALIMLHSLLEYPLWYGPFQMAFGLCIGLLGWPPKAADWPANPAARETSASNMPLASVLYALLAINLIVFLIYAAWDYRRVSQIYLPLQERSLAYRSDTLAKIQETWLFQSQARFAELTLTPLAPGNAAHLNLLAHELLHFSPEARVVEKLIDSAQLLGRDDEAQRYAMRYRLAYPAEYALWAQKNEGR